jgi:hypothetical protein
LLIPERALPSASVILRSWRRRQVLRFHQVRPLAAAPTRAAESLSSAIPERESLKHLNVQHGKEATVHGRPERHRDTRQGLYS